MARHFKLALALALLLAVGVHCQGTTAGEAKKIAAEEAEEAALEAKYEAEDKAMAAAGGGADTLEGEADDKAAKAELTAIAAEEVAEKALEAKLDSVEAKQEAKQDTSAEVVEAQIVVEAPKATLFNGDGDVSTTGAPPRRRGAANWRPPLGSSMGVLPSVLLINPAPASLPRRASRRRVRGRRDAVLPGRGAGGGAALHLPHPAAGGGVQGQHPGCGGQEPSSGAGGRCTAAGA